MTVANLSVLPVSSLTRVCVTTCALVASAAVYLVVVTLMPMVSPIPYVPSSEVKSIDAMVEVPVVLPHAVTELESMVTRAWAS